ncbi:hypothetical protein [Mycobacterium sp. MUNTM1]
MTAANPGPPDSGIDLVDGARTAIASNRCDASTRTGMSVRSMSEAFRSRLAEPKSTQLQRERATPSVPFVGKRREKLLHRLRPNYAGKPRKKDCATAGDVNSMTRMVLAC